MEKEWGVRIQRQFTKLHRIIFPIVIVYILIGKFVFDLKIGLIPVFVLIIFLVLETVLFAMKNIPSMPVLILRYVEGIFACCCMINAEGNLRYSFYLVLLFLFGIEYYLNFDILESYFRTICILTISVPMMAYILVQNIYNEAITTSLLTDVCICIIYTLLIAFLGEMTAREMHNYEQKLFAQKRLLESINETNEELRINQEKVKRANDLLGVQKIKLETANKRIENANAQMQIQNQIMKYISTSLEIEKLMKLITESISQEIGADMCVIVLYENQEQDRKMKYQIETHLNQEFQDILSRSIEQMCFEKYVENDFVYYDNRVDEKKYSFLGSSLIGSLMLTPLLQDGKRIGVFCVGYPKYDFFTEDNKQFFENIVSQFLIALNNANMYMRMENMAIKDGLTNIYNRRHLTQMFNEAMNEAILSKQQLSVALFDIDKFKNVNDKYGHLFGDVVIKTVAQTANQYAQKAGGFAGRYGGEEFVIVFPNTSLEDSYKVVQTIHQDIKKQELVHNHMIVHITVSAGVTSYPQTCSNPGELLNHADWAMYYSKEHGRDQITIDSDDVRREVRIQ